MLIGKLNLQRTVGFRYNDSPESGIVFINDQLLEQ